MNGKQAEKYVQKKLWGRGFSVRHVAFKEHFDLLVNNKIRLEVKSAFENKHGRFYFGISTFEQLRSYNDMFALLFKYRNGNCVLKFAPTPKLYEFLLSKAHPDMFTGNSHRSIQLGYGAFTLFGAEEFLQKSVQQVQT